MSFYGGRPGKRGTKWFYIKSESIESLLDEAIYNENDMGLDESGNVYVAQRNKDGNLEFIDTGANITGPQGLQGDNISSIELVTDPADSNYMNLEITLFKSQNGNFIEETKYIGPIGIDNITMNDNSSLIISVGDKEYVTEPLGITDIINNENTSLKLLIGDKEYTTDPLGITSIKNNDDFTISLYRNDELLGTSGYLRGETGRGLTIIEHVDNSSLLPESAELGDAYSVGLSKEIYIYIRSNGINQWMNYGQLGSISVKEGTETPETLSPDSFYLKTDTNELFIGLDNGTPFKVSSSDKMDKVNPAGTGSFTFNGKTLISEDGSIELDTHLATKGYVDSEISKIDVSSQIIGKMDKDSPSGEGSFTLDNIELIPEGTDKTPTADTHLVNKSYIDNLELITEEELKTIFGTEIISAYDEGVGF